MTSTDLRQICSVAFNNMKKVENVLMRSPLGYYSEFPKNTLTVEEKIQTQTFSSVGFHS